MEKTSQPYSTVLETPFAMLGLVFEDETLIRIDYLEDGSVSFSSNNKAIQNISGQIKRYCEKTLDKNAFDARYELTGTAFQKKVWNQIEAIAYGQTRTYGDIARCLKTSPRAVGNACRANPMVLLVPCHRVVSASGMGGYLGKTSGKMAAIKKWLLAHEALH